MLLHHRLGSSLWWTATTTTLLVILLESASSASCDAPCEFTVPPQNESDCRVYGFLSSSAGVNRAIPFHRANETCLDTYNISFTNMNLEDLTLVCPYENGTSANPSALTNILKEVGHVEGVSIKQQFPQYFFFNNATQDYELKPSVANRLGVPVDCVASPFFCWQEIVIYFGNDEEGVRKFAEICAGMYQRFVRQSTREQSTIRQLLCNLGADAFSPNCEPLASQVKQYSLDNTCDAMGNQATKNEIPETNCPGEDSSSSIGTRGRWAIAVGILSILVPPCLLELV